MRTTHFIPGRDEVAHECGPIPFPSQHPVDRVGADHQRMSSREVIPGTVNEVMATFDSMSRRIKDLARELNCLGFFDDPNNDLPRAA